MKIDGVRASDRTTELVLGFYAACNRGDAAAILAMVTDDIVHEINQGSREQGKEALERYINNANGSLRQSVRDVVVMSTQQGRRAAAEYVVDGRYLKTIAKRPAAHGQSYHLSGGTFFEIEDGKIARISNHFNLADWQRQVKQQKSAD